MLTEDEARQKWCPFARVATDGGGNRYPMDTDLAHGHAFARCIASACMAWRWKPRVYSGDPKPGVHPEAPGYCGLAGKP